MSVTLAIQGWEGGLPEPGDLLVLAAARLPKPDGLPARLYLVLRAEEAEERLLVTCERSGPQPRHWRAGALRPPRFPLGRLAALWAAP